MPTATANCGPCGGVAPVASRHPTPGESGESPAPAGPSSFLRPRFFANQLLTEEDLRRLDAYIVGKQHLYNRHFHDWGVVCGLMVSCGGCDSGEVVVSGGHALTALGQDILVCEPERVDICALLGTPAEPDTPCPDPVTESAERSWLLSIHYEEKLIARRRSADHCGCAAQACTCSGSEPTCQPSVVCESHHFELTEVSRDPGAGDTGPIAGFMASFIDCMQPIADWVAASRTGSGAADPQRVLEALQQLKWVLAEAIPAAAEVECGIEKRLNAIAVPQSLPPDNDPAAAQAFQEAFARALSELQEIFAAVVKACMCRAALPPCPRFEPGGVPLALVTVRTGKDCAVLRVCNWGSRKLAHTLPNLAYWIAPVPERVKEFLAQLCCAPPDLGPIDPGSRRTSSPMEARVVAGAAPAAAWAPAGIDALRRALPRALRDRMSADEMRRVATGLASALADPSRRAAPEEALRQLSALGLERAQAWSRPAPRSDDDVATLRREVEDLRSRLAALEPK